jgi:cell division septum initiation protein DivIVA
MADLRTLYKGAAGVRKGQAMLAWLGDVADALTEVGDLGRTLEKLREETSAAQVEHDSLGEEIKIMRGKHTGAEAEARRIRADAGSAATAIVEGAEIEAAAVVEKAAAQAAAYTNSVETYRATHKEFLAKAGAEEVVLRGKVAKLTEELAVIKARL